MEGNNYSPTTCPKCGETLNDGQRFCPSCGADIDAYKNRSCAKCGAAIADGQTFCTECGAKYLDPNSKAAKAKKIGKKILIGLLIALGLFIALIVAALCTADTHHHEWAAAICTEPKTCTECGKTEGEPLGHTAGDWELDDPDYVTATVWMRQRCTTCGASLDSKLKKFTTLCENGELLLTPDEFTQRCGKLLEYCFSEYGTQLISADSESLGCVITKNKTTHIGTVLFNDSDDKAISNKDGHGIANMMVGFKSTEKTEIAKATVALVMTLNPSLEFDDAKSVAVKIFDGTYTYNGIKYVFAAYSGAYYMSISIE